jgi:hypothetical protein
VLLQHQFVVHLVDVIAGQDHHVFGLVGFDDVDVLEHRIGRAVVPLGFGNALARRQNIEALVALGTQKVPSPLQVADQRVSLVLGRHPDAADARVEGVGEGEIDNSCLAAEIDRRFGAPVGELFEPAAAAARQDIGHRVTCQRLCPFLLHCFLPYSVSRPVYPGVNIIVANGGNVRSATMRPSSRRACTSPMFPCPEPP